MIDKKEIYVNHKKMLTTNGIEFLDEIAVTAFEDGYRYFQVRKNIYHVCGSVSFNKIVDYELVDVIK